MGAIYDWRNGLISLVLATMFHASAYSRLELPTGKIGLDWIRYWTLRRRFIVRARR
jgi:hypothetical protein